MPAETHTLMCFFESDSNGMEVLPSSNNWPLLNRFFNNESCIYFPKETAPMHSRAFNDTSIPTCVAALVASFMLLISSTSVVVEIDFTCSGWVVQRMTRVAAFRSGSLIKSIIPSSVLV